MQIYLAKPRGFCAGVNRSVSILSETIDRFPDETVYMKHQIIHNAHVVAEFEARGVRFVETLEELPDGALAVFSAHGSPPEAFERARARGIRIIDTTCPLVLKVHAEAAFYRGRGYEIVYVGTAGHAEAIGVEGHAVGHFHLVSKTEHVDALAFPAGVPLALLTQTTLSVDDTRALIERIRGRFPDIALPKKSDICYATQNRQEAVKALAAKTGTVIVVGSSNSSNSVKLRLTAERAGARAFLVDNFHAVTPDMYEGVRAVGVTGGASAPEVLIRQVVRLLEKAGGEYAGEIETVEETEHFGYDARIFAV